MRKKSFLDESIAIAVNRKVEQILDLVKKQGEPWETVVIEELVELIQGQK